MAIEIRPTGEAAAVSQAGQQIGQAEKAKREQQISLERQAQDAARAWEIQKFILNSQQDFAHEQRMRQADLDVEARAKEWEREKMELASRLDFEQDEKKRLRDKAMLDSGMETIDDSDAPEPEKARARFNLKSKFMHIEGYEETLGFNPKGGLFDFGIDRGTPTDQPTASNPLGLDIVATTVPTQGMSDVTLSLEQQNKFNVISPDGKKETIDADQWPDYKARGYVLAQISRKSYTTTTLGEYGGF
jgi:hypothetical protein